MPLYMYYSSSVLEYYMIFIVSYTYMYKYYKLLNFLH
jgi:hypothetical protein